MRKKIEIKRFNILMPAELFSIMKKVAVDNSCTMTKWALRAIVEKLKRDGDVEEAEKR